MYAKPMNLVSIMALMSVVGPAIAQEYDLVITSGRVMDPETQYDEVANVGIRVMDLETNQDKFATVGTLPA